MSRRQRGVALVSVLLVVAIATALAYAMVDRQGFTIAHSQQTLAGSQARQFALGGEQYARQILHSDWEDEETREIDTLLEEWSAPGEAFEVRGGALEIRIQDLERRFNLNAVAGDREGAQNTARLKRLLTALQIDANLADRWVDWVDADQDVTALGSEDVAHLMGDPPRRAANQRAAHVSEFVVATGLDAQAFERLRPHITVLPIDDLHVNVNTANEIVLGTLAPNFTTSRALGLVEQEREIARVEDITGTHPELGEAVAVLTVQSAFFRVQARAEVDGARSELTSLLHRHPETGALTLLWRSYGERFEALAWHEHEPEESEANGTMRQPDRRG
ncbi:MAG: type II secretion system minor pseudopilin GspK [Gammaproteobacteria bacterium]|nr:type II secretion system minor pseudopilin GspK [Gammaproteobacteria bacterium]